MNLAAALFWAWEFDVTAAVDNLTLHNVLDQVLSGWTGCWLHASWEQNPDVSLGWEVQIVCDLYDTTTGDTPEEWPHQQVVLNNDPQLAAWLEQTLENADPHVLTEQDLQVEDGVSRDAMTLGLLQTIVQQFT